MADYYPLIARAVAGLDKNTGDARHALYDRARAALVAQLRRVKPAGEVLREQLALEQATGRPLKIAGQGTPVGPGEYLGVLGPHDRGELMAHARACFVPTIYVEPFGNVAIEAMACGTPVICTDWGAFTETVIQNRTGFRCRMFQQFVDAVENADKLNPAAIRNYALANYSLEAVAQRYDEYFRRLLTLWDDGWYQRREPLPWQMLA